MARIFNRRGGWSKHIDKTYRSGLEETIARQLASAGVTAEYEKLKIKYQKPTTTHTYTPDFVLESGIIIESKGLFEADDRKKHLLIQSQHPELDIRFIFTNPNTKINKGSKTTYADWCKKNGFLYAKGLIPSAWLKEVRKEA